MIYKIKSSFFISIDFFLKILIISMSKKYMHRTVASSLGSGFFSCCGSLLELILNYNKMTGEIPLFVDNSFSFRNFKTIKKEKEDIFFDFFDEPRVRKAKVGKIKNKITKEISEFKKFEKIEFEQINFLIKTFFEPNEEIKKIKKEIEDKFNINPKNTCSVLYRGNDKITEMEGTKKSWYLKEIKKINKKEKGLDFFIQTDDSSFLQYAESFISKEINYKTAGEYIRLFKDKNHSVNTFFGTNDKSRNENYKYAKNFLAIMMIIAESKYIICNSGNVGLWACLFRGNAKNVVQKLPKKVFL